MKPNGIRTAILFLEAVDIDLLQSVKADGLAKAVARSALFAIGQPQDVDIN